MILACSFLFLWHLCLVLELRWWWPHRTTPVFLPEKSHGPGSLVCYSQNQMGRGAWCVTVQRIANMTWVAKTCVCTFVHNCVLECSFLASPQLPLKAPQGWLLHRLVSEAWVPQSLLAGNWDAEGWEHGMMAFPWRWIHLEPWTVCFHVYPHGFLRYLTLVSPNSITGLLIILKTVSPFGLPMTPGGMGSSLFYR